MKWCVVFFLFFYSCSTEVKQTFKSAYGNKMDLYKVLMHYRFVDIDSEKYKAALFLVENMKYHYSSGKIIQDNPDLEQWRAETDSIYFGIIKNSTLDNFPWDTLKKTQQIRHKELDSVAVHEVKSNNELYLDCQYLSSEFIIEHIDNAFKVWETSKFARNLTFDEFKEYILPYRSIRGYGFHTSGDKFHDLFSKYVLADTSLSLREHVQHYNLAINGMRNLNGRTKRKEVAGIYDLYDRSSHACIEIANYGCNILRACGIPTVVEFNICYRNFGGRHYHCNAYDTNKVWKTFNAESSLPGDGDWAFAHTLNVYRELYGAQENTPFFLKNRDEYVPPVLSSPCIQDVTSNLQKTVAIKLPFSEETTNHLAYLGTFHKESGGLIPVTWGEIDTLSNTISFEHAIPNMIYFPIYYPSKNFEVFGDPFYVKLDSSGASVLPIPGIDGQKDSLITLVINRKFPQKPNMLKVAQNLVGGQFLGANKWDFSDAKVLYEIKEAPTPYFLNYRLKNRTSYQYYRFQAPKKHPNANISMLEWVTRKSFNYTNVHKVSRPHLITPDGVKSLKNESRFVKLLDAKSWDDMKWKMEYDGNMQTAPGAYPSITLSLQSPQVVTDIRFSPRNADNGITNGDEFELFYWNDGWQYGGKCKAKYEYVSFEKIPANKLYWLVNKTRGKEELVFTMVDGKQSFLYYDMLNE